MPFELSWETIDGRFQHYWNLSGQLVESTLLMDVRAEPLLNPATIKIRGQDKPATVKFQTADGEWKKLA